MVDAPYNAAAPIRGRSRAMRITGGSLGGRKLASPPRGVRPSADRVRESLFGRLTAWDHAEAWNVLDLYAGTGALGIEALSRGAARAVFVERSRPALAVLRRNLHVLDLEGRSRVLAADVRGVARRLAAEGECFQLVLADPPYADAEPAGPLAELAAEGLLAPDAVVVVERSRRHSLPEIPGLRPRDSRRYGDTVLEWLVPTQGGDPETQGEPPA